MAQALQIRVSKLARANAPRTPPDAPGEHNYAHWLRNRRMDIVFICRRGKPRSVALADIIGT